MCSALQVLANPFWTTYTLWGAFASVGFIYISRFLNTVEGLSSDISFSMQHIGKAKKVSSCERI